MRNRYELQNPFSASSGNVEYERKRRRSSIHSVSFFTAILLLFYLLALYGVAYFIYGVLPKPLKLSDEANYPDSFIAERAQHDLKLLTDLGPRVLGSYENEVLSVDILTREIAFIQQQANRNLTIELDVQVVTGSYFLGYKPNGVINAYSNVQNVIVRVLSANNSQNSILVNAHFDSVPTSPGGSDDGINCAVMLEVLRKISRSPDPPRHNVIFLFNGAEESPLQAAHGFISQHEWAKSVKVVVNLEAAGAGGKIILFQTGPNKPWLLKYYNRVPHPIGTATGEELFQSGLIPSDTDFRIFRDFGNTIGFDMAFINNGYRYHTKFDGFSNIPLGSFQHAGDNTLSLVKSLADAEEIDDLGQQSEGKVIFFDFFGVFMISYNNTVAIILNVLVSVVSFATFAKAFKDFEIGFSKQTCKYLALTLAAIIIGWILAVLFVVIIAYTIDGVNFTMSWYGNPWIIFGLYSVPTVAITSLGFIVLNRYFGQAKWCISVESQIQIHITRLIWTAVLIIGTILQIRSMFFIMVPIAFQSLILLIVHITKLQHSVKVWKLLYIAGLILPTAFVMYFTVILFSFIIPICGRIGNDRNPELIVGFLTLFFTVFITSFYVPLVTLVRRPFMVLATCGLLFLAAFIIIFTPLGFPYSGNKDVPTPERFYIYHTSRVFHNESGDVVKSDSGFFLINLDRNSPASVKNHVVELQKAKSVADDCDVALFCGLPIFSIRMVSVLKKSTWIPAGKPVIHEPIKLTVNYKQNVSPSLIRYKLTAKGPDHQAIYLSPKENVQLKSINLLNDSMTPSVQWNDRPTYIIVHTYGKEKADLNIEFDVEVPEGWNSTTTVDIALIGSYVHKRITRTPLYVDFLGKFPDWADVVPFVGAYESWVI